MAFSITQLVKEKDYCWEKYKEFLYTDNDKAVKYGKLYMRITTKMILLEVLEKKKVVKDVFWVSDSQQRRIW